MLAFFNKTKSVLLTFTSGDVLLHAPSPSAPRRFTFFTSSSDQTSLITNDAAISDKQEQDKHGLV